MEPTTADAVSPNDRYRVPPPPVTMSTTRIAHAGQLTPGWSRAMMLTWLFVITSFIAVWVSSRNTGLSTWWLGPETEPRFLLINLLPFVVPTGMCLLCQLNVRRLPWFGIAGAVATAVIATGDVDRVPGYAVTEFTIAGGALLVSLACFAGLLRDAPT
ncbi:MAG: hypothetical protein HY826_11725 [Actinobacteria bacterium]|nr:hypothetical protein [Actinomycetota bacterium]